MQEQFLNHPVFALKDAERVDGSGPGFVVHEFQEAPEPALGIRLLGLPVVSDRFGNALNITSKRAIALLALVATARNGERSRAWLQHKLWGTRDDEHGRASLRRELSNLRKVLGAEADCLLTDHRSVGLDLARVDIDLEPRHANGSADEFLEGLDIPGEEGFEDWLREARAQFSQAERRETPVAPIALPRHSAARPTNTLPILTIPPFVAASACDTQIPFRVALRQAMIDSLSRICWLDIKILPDRAHSKQGDPFAVDHPESAGYLLEATTNARAGRLMADLSLLSLPSRRVVWTDTLELRLSEPRRIQNRVCQRAANLIAQRIDHLEQPAAMTPRMWAPGCPTSPGHTPTHRKVAERRRLRSHCSLPAQPMLDHGFTVSGKVNDAANDVVATRATERDMYRECLLVEANNARVDAAANADPSVSLAAMQHFARRAMQLDPTDSRPPLLLGLYELKCGDLGLALRFFDQALANNPGEALAHALSGTCQYLTGRLDDARQSLETAYFLSPMAPFRLAILGELAIVRILLGDFDAALAATQEMQVIDPQAAVTRFLELTAREASPAGVHFSPANLEPSPCGAITHRALCRMLATEQVLELYPFKAACRRLFAQPRRGRSDGRRLAPAAG